MVLTREIMILIHLILIRDFSHNSYLMFNTSNRKNVWWNNHPLLAVQKHYHLCPPVVPCKQRRAARTTGADSPSRCRLVPRTWIKVINNDCLASLLVPLLRIYIYIAVGLLTHGEGYVPGTRGINYEELNHFTSDIVLQVCLPICDKYWKVRGWWSSLSRFYVSTCWQTWRSNSYMIPGAALDKIYMIPGSFGILIWRFAMLESLQPRVQS